MVRALKRFFHNKESLGLIKISDEKDYHNLFLGKSIDSNEKLAKAYEKAWDARKFEIDNYWKRTTYFWAFQITSFTGYLAVLNSNSYTSLPGKNSRSYFA